jgi:hypothetical protein
VVELAVQPLAVPLRRVRLRLARRRRPRAHQAQAILRRRRADATSTCISVVTEDEILLIAKMDGACTNGEQMLSAS